ncbi:NAD-dependent epimerase/dehydratase family protein [Neisseria wadsworthii]|uniref:NAD(P)-binding domain-containing protein n=1 Tax=Neisseria wadsworthii 9715 TaxID=1030841 RepID=G4CTM2_9NEIS|nr:NAD-dependent epimerase/dehydratase family protein [Neisseria wadsworthii]EGZ44127.1 hypothetical protein HMPREF9370_2432 [Neisseria wadsworthii 9715]
MMNIVLFGGSGFIGKRVGQMLSERGHRVKAVQRVDFDYLQPQKDRLMPLLQGADCVVNAVGVMSYRADVLETVHHIALLEIARFACEAGVRRFVQLSALGAHKDHETAFLGSKGRGDAALLQSGLDVGIARPSVVFGRGGASCELFIKLAKLLLLPLPEGGAYRLQPVHVDDVAEGLCKMAEQPTASPAVVEMTGSRECSLAEYLAVMRRNIHGKNTRKIIPIPAWVADLAAYAAKRFSNGMVSPDSMKLLRAGSVAESAGFEALLGRKPLPVDSFQ